jgi:hypothetical protein
MNLRHKRISVRAGLLLAILVCAGIVIAAIKPERAITISVNGAPNQMLTARFLADDTVTDEVVQALFERSFTANRFSFWLLPDEPSGESEILLQIVVDGVPWWPSNNNTLSLDQGIKGTLQTPRTVSAWPQSNGNRGHLAGRDCSNWLRRMREMISIPLARKSPATE